MRYQALLQTTECPAVRNHPEVTPAGEEDHKWSGESASKEVSEDGSDWDSD